MTETAADETSDDSDGTLCTGVVTIASDRSLETDEPGEALTEILEADGNEVTVREHVGPDHDTVQSIVSRLIDRNDVHVVITAGATGVESTDVTLEAVAPLLEKELATFSELFTVLAYEQVGTSAVTARTLAGIADETPVFCLPGNTDAVRLALEEIVLSEAPEIIDCLREDESNAEDDEDVKEDDDAESDPDAAAGDPTEVDATDGGA
ncbi:MogA/MoaB family molybdenum cofactor biosynthesis protein [Natrinema longum]|uniref:Molybdenum cofactor biosynthesis protein n=1 Tax=Natrinema longum TaxID=370324 RepID=A0A8A2UE69_9EURY|nr:molybdopterin-binding protein [Natrinema longum]MBZ6495539.1 molybdenum cofactor biosynthesis protein [Natrinema longum]QSW86495.1 molybdenum cofactor biosynthesis protein [Natrinema longum]